MLFAFNYKDTKIQGFLFKEDNVLAKAFDVL
jgi:hypothetical protein